MGAAAANDRSPAGELRAAIDAVREQMALAVRGKDAVIEHCLYAIVAGGHILLEDRPGVGKTTLAQGLAQSLGVRFARIQFTADLLPTDVLGMSVWSPNKESFSFHPGPVFSQLLLADEINRAPARTQSALLQAMAERKVSVDGEDRLLYPGFCVIATQNPGEHSGTYPLPQSQRDRFSLRISMGYPDPASEIEIYRGQLSSPDTLKAKLGPETLLELQAQVRAVHVHEDLAGYVQSFAQTTRDSNQVELGLSVRACLSWLGCAKAKAWMEGRSMLLPDDLQALAPDCLAHRIWVRDCPVSAQQQHAEDLVQEFLAQSPLP